MDSSNEWKFFSFLEHEARLADFIDVARIILIIVNRAVGRMELYIWSENNFRLSANWP